MHISFAFNNRDIVNILKGFKACSLYFYKQHNALIATLQSNNLEKPHVNIRTCFLYPKPSTMRIDEVLQIKTFHLQILGVMHFLEQVKCFQKDFQKAYLYTTQTLETIVSKFNNHQDNMYITINSTLPLRNLNYKTPFEIILFRKFTIK